MIKLIPVVKLWFVLFLSSLYLCAVFVKENISSTNAFFYTQQTQPRSSSGADIHINDLSTPEDPSNNLFSSGRHSESSPSPSRTQTATPVQLVCQFLPNYETVNFC